METSLPPPVSELPEPADTALLPGLPPVNADLAMARRDHWKLTGWQGVFYDLGRTPISWYESLRYKLSHLPEINYELGRSLSARGAVKDAIMRYRIALWLAPNYQPAWYHLGTCYLSVGNPPKALAAFAKAYALAPNDEETRFMIATIDPAVLPASKKPRGMPRSIAVEYFDRMAPTYDESQLAMRYRGHMMAENTLRDLIDTTRHDHHLLDLGCGTGLVGALLGRYAERIVGIDQSPAMLARAEVRRRDNGSRLYTDVFHQEISEYLADSNDRFQLVTAVHVLNYMGDLSAVFAQVGKSLVDNGLFLFQHEVFGGDEYGLMAGTGRFGHTEAYILRLLAENGLERVQHEQVRIYPEYPMWQWVVTRPAPVPAPAPVPTPAAKKPAAAKKGAR